MVQKSHFMTLINSTSKEFRQGNDGGLSLGLSEGAQRLERSSLTCWVLAGTSDGTVSQNPHMAWVSSQQGSSWVVGHLIMPTQGPKGEDPEN